MASRRTGKLSPLLLAVAALPACNPYTNFSGEFYAGAIDPTNFAAPYVGELPGTADQSGGVIAAAHGFVGGKPIFYYNFPFTDAQNAQFDPLTIASDSAPAPKGFVFDVTMTSPFPDPAKCIAPKNYVFDQRTEAYRKDEQGVIFDSIPSDPGYIPVIAETVVTSMGEHCQDIKSKQTMLSRKNVSVPTIPDGKYLAFAEIDPGADVQPNQLDTGLGPIHLGWYNKYLIAFIDGGYVPTEDIIPAGTNTSNEPVLTRMKPQTLYTPSVVPVTDPSSQQLVPGLGGLGTDWDILEAARGDATYSPVCHVVQYTPDDPLHPKRSFADFSDTELDSTGSATADQGYIFCFQTEPTSL